MIPTQLVLIPLAFASQFICCGKCGKGVLRREYFGLPISNPWPNKTCTECGTKLWSSRRLRKANNQTSYRPPALPNAIGNSLTNKPRLHLRQIRMDRQRQNPRRDILRNRQRIPPMVRHISRLMMQRPRIINRRRNPRLLQRHLQPIPRRRIPQQNGVNSPSTRTIGNPCRYRNTRRQPRIVNRRNPLPLRQLFFETSSLVNKTAACSVSSRPFMPVRNTSYRVVPSPCVRRLRYNAARSALSVSNAPPSP